MNQIRFQGFAGNDIARFRLDIEQRSINVEEKGIPAVRQQSFQKLRGRMRRFVDCERFKHRRNPRLRNGRKR
ncbi:hypothetical protein [Beijerinckia mobilis]|uniref:hypothetical protein n=1 Tax=Beijerinckia mobilis TaxID=231434 RepID=UPI001FDA00F5|nr:hypothetical protein [Beijerinckia mobilis]